MSPIKVDNVAGAERLSFNDLSDMPGGPINVGDITAHNILPEAHNTYDLGDVTHKWKDIAGINVYGDTGSFGTIDVNEIFNTGSYVTFSTPLKIDDSSTTALLVEDDGTKDNTLVVDTVNGRVGINTQPSYPLHLMIGATDTYGLYIDRWTTDATTAAHAFTSILHAAPASSTGEYRAGYFDVSDKNELGARSTLYGIDLEVHRDTNIAAGTNVPGSTYGIKVSAEPTMSYTYNGASTKTFSDYGLYFSNNDISGITVTGGGTVNKNIYGGYFWIIEQGGATETSGTVNKNLYAGYFYSQVVDASGTVKGVGVYSKATGADTNYDLMLDGAENIALDNTGILTIVSTKSAGNNEDLTLDFETTANTVAFGTNTGVTDLDFGSFNLTTTGLGTLGASGNLSLEVKGTTELNENVRIGSSVAPTVALDVTGDILTNGTFSDGTLEISGGNLTTTGTGRFDDGVGVGEARADAGDVTIVTNDTYAKWQFDKSASIMFWDSTSDQGGTKNGVLSITSGASATDAEGIGFDGKRALISAYNYADDYTTLFRVGAEFGVYTPNTTPGGYGVDIGVYGGVTNDRADWATGGTFLNRQFGLWYPVSNSRQITDADGLTQIGIHASVANAHGLTNGTYYCIDFTSQLPAEGNSFLGDNKWTGGTFNYYGFKGRIGSFTADGTTANLYGYYSSCGTLTVDSGVINSWGIYLTGYTNADFSIWSDGGDNALAGNTRIGSTTAPTVALDVTGQTNSTLGFNCGDAGGFSGMKFDAANTHLTFWIDGVQVAHIDNKGVYTDDIP